LKSAVGDVLSPVGRARVFLSFSARAKGAGDCKAVVGSFITEEAAKGRCPIRKGKCFDDSYNAEYTSSQFPFFAGRSGYGMH
jgi:hypothetical protein